jgi:hypothetical protein
MIALLRHPVDRAFSSYWHTVKSGLETLSFDEAVRCEEERNCAMTDPALKSIRPFAYIERGFYYRQISAYLKYFSREQLHIALFEDLIQVPAKTVREIFGFLGVDASFVPKSWRIENTSTPRGAEMAKDTRRLLLERYREDNERLSVLLQRDLSGWKE